MKQIIIFLFMVLVSCKKEEPTRSLTTLIKGNWYNHFKWVEYDTKLDKDTIYFKSDIPAILEINTKNRIIFSARRDSFTEEITFPPFYFVEETTINDNVESIQFYYDEKKTKKVSGGIEFDKRQMPYTLKLILSNLPIPKQNKLISAGFSKAGY